MDYTKTNVLGLQLRGMMNLRRLTRAELFTRLQVIRTVEPAVAEAFRISEEKIHRDALDDSPHGESWHLSFHGSQFPGDNPLACPRQSLYRMMNFPSPEPVSRLLRQTADSGKACEVTLVNAFLMAGMLISSPDPNRQTKFEFEPAWLTGTVDAVITLKGSEKPVPIEIKERKAEVIKEMQYGARGPYPEHVSQIKVEIAFTRYYQKEGLLWDDRPDCTHGMLYYVSRDNPLETAEFRIDHDEHFWVEGIDRLKRWRAYFEEDLLPELNPGKRSTIFGHPNGWKWSKKPCQFCDFKKTCQLDFREGNTTLSGSIGIDRARRIRPDYDVESSRLRVRARWQKKKETTTQEV